MTPMEDVIRDVAVENGVGLEKKDPVMVLVTIQNRLNADYYETLCQQQAVALESFRQDLENAVQTTIDGSKANLVKGLNSVLTIAKENVNQIMTTGADEVVKRVNTEIGKAVADHQAAMARYKSLIEGKVLLGIAVEIVIAAIVILAYAL